jgi:hypothetical protein
MNHTLLSGLVALVPAVVLFSGSLILFVRRKALSSFLQLFGAGCLVLVPSHMCAKHFACFRGWVLVRSIVWLTMSICAAPFWA